MILIPQLSGSRLKPMMRHSRDPLPALRAALEAPLSGSSDYDLNPDTVLPANRKLRPAAVLVAIEPHRDGPRVLLTKRAAHLDHHPGQVAFPGGKVDPVDRDDNAAALREAQEEVGLDPSNVAVLGHLSAHETVTGFRVTPVVGALAQTFTPVPEAGEVDEVFHVPLAFLSDLSNYNVEARRWNNQWRRYYTVPYGPYYIWGATARMLMQLSDAMAQ